MAFLAQMAEETIMVLAAAGINDHLRQGEGTI